MTTFRTSIPVLSLAAFALLGCAPNWEGSANFRYSPSANIGDISHSFPILTPIKPPTDDNQKLQFGEMRSEKNLSEAIQQSNLSIDDVTATFQEIGVGLAYAGDRVSQNQQSKTSRGGQRNSKSSVGTESSGTSAVHVINVNTDNRTASSDSKSEVAGKGSVSASANQDASTEESSTTEYSSSRGYSTPDAPELPSHLTLPTSVEGKLVSLLERAQKDHTLTVDDVATITASLKMYMIGLEDFFNVTALYESADNHTSEWLPYRMHFVATIDPGWFTQNGDYDAVLELQLGDTNNVRVINAVPPQTAQAIDAFTASYKNLSTSLQASGSQNRVAARAAVKRLKAAAERLQGVRSNTTFSASFPTDNRMRLRFHASKIADRNTPTQLQPTSRVITATILVKKNRERDEVREKRIQEDPPAANESSIRKVIASSPNISLESRMWFETARNQRIRRPHRDIYCVHSDRPTKGEKVPESCDFTPRSGIEAPSWELARSHLALRNVIGEFWDPVAPKDPKDPKVLMIPAPALPAAYDGVIQLNLATGSPLDESYDVTIAAPGVSFTACPKPGVLDSPTTCKKMDPGEHILQLAIDPAKVGDAKSIHAFLKARVHKGSKVDATRATTTRVELVRIELATPPKPAQKPTQPTITIKGNDITVNEVPIKDIPIEVLKAILGERVNLSILGAAKAK